MVAIIILVTSVLLIAGILYVVLKSPDAPKTVRRTRPLPSRAGSDVSVPVSRPVEAKVTIQVSESSGSWSPFKKKPSRFSNRKSIYSMTDDDLRSKFGEDWKFARRVIEEKKDLIKRGLATDWDSVREEWDKDEPITENQDAILMSRNIHGVDTKYEASFIIDELFLKDEFIRLKIEEEREQARQKKLEQKELERLEKLAQKEALKRQKEEVALKMLAKEMADPNYKPRRLKAQRSKDLLEFQTLVNSIMEDDVITVDELKSIDEWLQSHKVLDGDFAGMQRTIRAALADGVVDENETKMLYEGMLDCIVTLRKRA